MIVENIVPDTINIDNTIHKIETLLMSCSIYSTVSKTPAPEANQHCSPLKGIFPLLYGLIIMVFPSFLKTTLSVKFVLTT
ncbi:MAG: hypothetical protein LBC20_01310 [Planctomycetaceae bacterium]|nr:hypothetical protein [Planctomycetaceae bacterium]